MICSRRNQFDPRLNEHGKRLAALGLSLYYIGRHHPAGPVGHDRCREKGRHAAYLAVKK
jgi:hypothetical protein